MVKSINVSQKSNFESKPLTLGTQEARICRIIDLGIQPPRANNKFDTGAKAQLKFMFELAEDKVTIGDEVLPAFISMNVNLATGDRSKLFKLTKAVGLSTTENISFEDFLGKPISLHIEAFTSDDGREIHYVGNFAGVSKNVASAIPELVADSYIFDFDDPSEEIFNKLSDGIKKVLSNAINFSGSKVETLVGGDGNTPKTPEERELDEGIM